MENKRPKYLHSDPLNPTTVSSQLIHITGINEMQYLEEMNKIAGTKLQLSSREYLSYSKDHREI